jgi:nucleoid-associated protein YgaU
MKLVTLLTLLLVLNACSFSDSRNEEVAVHQDDLEFAVDTIADAPANTEFKVEEQKVAQVDLDVATPDNYDIPPVEETMTAPQEPTFKDFTKPEVTAAALPEEVVTEHTAYVPTEAPAKINIDNMEHTISTNGAIEHYKFQKGDTLMMVAFKIYGDYRKWKDIKKWNKDKEIIVGTELMYYMPEQKFGWRPDGLPYLVKTGDTLQIISREKYNTVRRWKALYENNRPLIRNPNLIFAGFTIYYQPSRDLASQPK